MPKKVMARSVRKGRRAGTPPAEQMRVTFDAHGQPALKPFSPNVRWMVRAYGE